MQREIEKAPIPLRRASAAYARLAHPKIFGLYFNDKDPINPWVEKGWTRWSMVEWEGKYGNGISLKEEGTRYLDGEGRTWEFFGFTIPLYDADEKT